MAIDTRLQSSPSRYITYEEYLQDEGENHCTEWVDGKVIDISMVSDEHSEINLFILMLLQMWVQAHQAGIIRADPFNMKIRTKPARTFAGRDVYSQRKSGTPYAQPFAGAVRHCR